MDLGPEKLKFAEKKLIFRLCDGVQPFERHFSNQNQENKKANHLKTSHKFQNLWLLLRKNFGCQETNLEMLKNGELP